jgi:hypothetical protein
VDLVKELQEIYKTKDVKKRMEVFGNLRITHKSANQEAIGKEVM